MTIDEALALNGVGGDKKLWKKVLKNFYEDTIDKAAEKVAVAISAGGTHYWSSIDQIHGLVSATQMVEARYLHQ